MGFQMTTRSIEKEHSSQQRACGTVMKAGTRHIQQRAFTHAAGTVVLLIIRVLPLTGEARSACTKPDRPGRCGEGWACLDHPCLGVYSRMVIAGLDMDAKELCGLYMNLEERANVSRWDVAACSKLTTRHKTSTLQARNKSTPASRAAPRPSTTKPLDVSGCRLSAPGQELRGNL